MSDREERWVELFDELRVLGAAERERRLFELEAQDPEMAGDLRDLLEAHDSDPEFLEPGGTSLPTIPGFRFLRKLGSGGRGSVYLAWQQSVTRLVAVKVLSPGSRLSSLDRERFRREGKTGARLKHPGIVQVFDGSEDPPTPYLVMEYVSGADLGTELEAARQRRPDARLFGQRGQSHPRVVAALVADVARALQHAHGQGVIHRDVKPSNILLDDDMRGRLVDLGTAKDAGDATITKTGSMEGTLNYMSPEQVRAARNLVDHRTDIYSLGVVLYELLTLKRPFQGETDVQTLANIETRTPAGIRTVNPDIARDLEVICEKAMSRRIEDRYASAGDMAEDLERFLAHRAIAARPLPPWTRLWRRVVRHRWQALTACACVLLFWGGSIVKAGLDRRAEVERLEQRLGAALASFDGLAREDVLGLRAEVESVRARHGSLEPVLERRRAELERAYRAACEAREAGVLADLERQRRPMHTGPLGEPVISGRRWFDVLGQDLLEAASYRGELDETLLNAVLGAVGGVTLNVAVRARSGSGPILFTVQKVDPILLQRGPIAFEGILGQDPVRADRGWSRLVFQEQGGGFAEVLRYFPAGGERYDLDLWLRPQPEVTRDMVAIAGGRFAERYGTILEGVGPTWESAEVDVPGFFIDREPMTNDLYAAFLRAVGEEPPAWWGSDLPPDFGRRPVARISLDEARRCAEYYGKRLPTSEEWHLAFQGTEGRRYPWGDALDGREDELAFDAPKPDFWEVAIGPPLDAVERRWYLDWIRPVDAFPAWAETPEGLRGGLGNTTDWTESRPFEYRGDRWVSRSELAICGGLPVHMARSIMQDYGYTMDFMERPTERPLTAGFRCVKSAQPWVESR